MADGSNGSNKVNDVEAVESIEAQESMETAQFKNGKKDQRVGTKQRSQLKNKKAESERSFGNANEINKNKCRKMEEEQSFISIFQFDPISAMPFPTQSDVQDLEKEVRMIIYL